MTPEEFKETMLRDSDQDVAALCLSRESVPYVFAGNEGAWGSFCAELNEGLGVEVADVRIVGSARFGFSLKPAMALRPFHDESDIDVVVVNAAIFDEMWYAALSAAYPRGATPMTAALRQRQQNIYTGWLDLQTFRFDKTIAGTRVVPILEFKAKWFGVFKKAARHAVRRHEDINARLYRTWEHVAMYHADSVRALRSTL